MSIELRMPALSPTMEKGTLAKWRVAIGDLVKAGDMLAEIETDKATMDFEAVDEGRIVALPVAEGAEDVPVGTVIAILSQSSDETPFIAAVEPVAAPARQAADAPAAVVAGAEPIVAAPGHDGVDATLLAKRIAAARNIALHDVAGTGADGRIVKADLGLSPRASIARPARSSLAASPSALLPPADVPFEAIKLSSMRKTIAARLTQAKQTIPHFYLTARCTLDALLALRAELNADLAPRGIKVSVNDILIKAMALALIEVPEANVQFGEDTLYRFGRVDIAMAIAIEGGLITPVVKDVGALSLSAIARETQRLAGLARAGKLRPEDYQGGTASISNLGMFGIDGIVPVINPPQAMILGVGAGVEQPWKVDGAIGLATILSATASFDHRAIDGATGARFMAALRDFIEHPIGTLC